MVPIQELLLGNLPPWIVDLLRSGKISSEDLEQPREPIPGLSGKEAADDPPEWVRGKRPMIKESGKDFAKRLMDEKYGPGIIVRVQEQSSIKSRNTAVASKFQSGSSMPMEHRVRQMATVYPLNHVYERVPGIDDVKSIGIYSSRERAEEAARRLRDKPGFKDHPDDFEIDEVEVDRDGWTSGFISAAEALES